MLFRSNCASEIYWFARFCQKRLPRSVILYRSIGDPASPRLASWLCETDSLHLYDISSYIFLSGHLRPLKVFYYIHDRVYIPRTTSHHRRAFYPSRIAFYTSPGFSSSDKTQINSKQRIQIFGSIPADRHRSKKTK